MDFLINAPLLLGVVRGILVGDPGLWKVCLAGFYRGWIDIEIALLQVVAYPGAYAAVAMEERLSGVGARVDGTAQAMSGYGAIQVCEGRRRAGSALQAIEKVTQVCCLAGHRADRWSDA